jgi:hypothetical protein
MPTPAPPAFSHHPVIQTLLKIVWRCHVEKYRLITTTFQNAIKAKVASTRKLRDFDDHLVLLENEVISKIKSDAVQSFTERMEAELAEIRAALRKEGSLEELLEQAIERGIAATGEDRAFFAPRFQVNLSKIASFEINRKLWDEWKLQVERHKLVFQGKLDLLPQIDEKIANLKVEEEEEEEEEPENSIAMFSQLYRAMVEQLSALKLEQEMQTIAIRKYELFLREKMKVAKMRAYTKIRFDIIQEEQVSIEAASTFLKDELAKIKVAQDRALSELKSARVEHDLKSMQVTIDLTLESAREFLYNEGLDALLPWA